MVRHNKAKGKAYIPREAAEPDPEQSPQVSSDEKGEPSSHLDQSQEPGENEEKRRVAEKLKSNEHDN